MAKSVLMATTGSLGDLHPSIAIGLELAARGHAVTLATSNHYREKIEKTGLGFAPMGPHIGPQTAIDLDRILDERRGPEYLMRKLMYPSAAAAYAEVMHAARGCDVLVTHPITFGAQVAAQKLGLPWVSTVTAPLSFFSRYDPSVIAVMPWAIRLRGLGPAVNTLLPRLGRAVTGRWMGPITALRRSVGLAPGANPLFEGQHSPKCVLALFSRLMAEPQPDWPPQARVTGFAFYDQAEHGQRMEPALERFLDAGEPPLVFTLGSSAVMHAGDFYTESVEAARQLGRRAVFLVGDKPLPEPLPPGCAQFAYAPYSQIFPRAAATIHSGGMGTCAQALAAGRPMLVVPFAFDQPDNAARLCRLGVARTIARRRYIARRAAAELEALLGEPAYAAKAAEAARIVAAENGARTAADAIEIVGG